MIFDSIHASRFLAASRGRSGTGAFAMGLDALADMMREEMKANAAAEPADKAPLVVIDSCPDSLYLDEKRERSLFYDPMTGAMIREIGEREVRRIRKVAYDLETDAIALGEIKERDVRQRMEAACAYFGWNALMVDMEMPDKVAEPECYSFEDAPAHKSKQAKDRRAARRNNPSYHMMANHGRGRRY